MTLLPHCIFRRGTGPIVGAAVHCGHGTRKRVESRLALNERERLREEDPYTAEWTQVAKTQIIGLRSRFEVDLNRPRDKAVYQRPEDAWNLEVWIEPPDESLIEASLKEYDLFYKSVEELLLELTEAHGRVVVYDLHTYNHRRDGEAVSPADRRENPDINIGTGTMNRKLWGPVVDRLIEDLRTYDFHGHSLDVRENVRFQGGYFGKWIHQMFPETACSIAIEIKKFFMNEWTGEGDLAEIEAIYEALLWTVSGAASELKKL